MNAHIFIPNHWSFSAFLSHDVMPGDGKHHQGLKIRIREMVHRVVPGSPCKAQNKGPMFIPANAIPLGLGYMTLPTAVHEDDLGRSMRAFHPWITAFPFLEVSEVWPFKAFSVGSLWPFPLCQLLVCTVRSGRMGVKGTTHVFRWILVCR